MNERQIRNLIRLVEEHEIDSLEISGWGPFQKVRIVGKGATHQNGHGGAPVSAGAAATFAPVQMQAQVPQPQVITQVAAAPAPAAVAPVPVPQPVASSTAVEIKSPMVGTFYGSPSPDSPPYVSVGDRVAAGQVICIVEAMKLMNEIEAEVSGRVAKILGQNGKPVEFGQVLFLIEPE